MENCCPSQSSVDTPLFCSTPEFNEYAAKQKSIYSKLQTSMNSGEVSPDIPSTLRTLTPQQTGKNEEWPTG